MTTELKQMFGGNLEPSQKEINEAIKERHNKELEEKKIRDYMKKQSIILIYII